MRHFWAAGWLVLFVLSARAGMGQAVAPQDSTVKLTMSAPLSLPLIYSLNTLPQRLSLNDSLDRRAFARNRVKTVALLRQRPARPSDTAEYYALDRRGNQVLRAKPYFGQHRQQRFDKRNRLVEVVMMPTADYDLSSRIVYDPKAQLHTTYVTAAGAAPVLWQQAQQSRRGDTLTTDAVFQPVPNLQTGPLHRLLMRAYRIGADTACIEAIGYDAAGQLADFTAYYRIGKPGQLLETGALDCRPTQPGAAAGLPAPPVSAAAQLQRARQQRWRFVPNTRNAYDQRGRLIQTTYISDPNAVITVSTASGSSNGPTTTTTATTGEPSPLVSYSTRYARTPDGRVQREERTYLLRAGITDPITLGMFKPSSTEYEYSPKGLLLRKTESVSNLTGRPTVYEVKYTYY